jgi:hypothetical protein
MEAFEFQTQMQEGDSLAVPPEVAKQLPRQAPLRVIVLVGDKDEERAWIRFGNEQFLKGYAESDAIYDDL